LLRNVRFLCAIGLHTQGMTVAPSVQMFREKAYWKAGNAPIPLVRAQLLKGSPGELC
jgi:hypothetical protein